MMKPVDYVNVVVLPTVREHFADNRDLRRGVLACIVTFHISDHIARAEGQRRSNIVCDRLRVKCRTEFDIVQGVCHGTKHGQTDAHLSHQHAAGDVVLVGRSAWGRKSAWGRFPWGKATVAVIHEGAGHRLGSCIGTVLRAFGELYPEHFPNDVLGLDALLELSRLPKR